MAKPKTNYSLTTKPPSTFARIVKNLTSYISGSGMGSILLSDPVVRLDSVIYFLSGFTAQTQNQLNNKNATTFNSTSKPDTTYGIGVTPIGAWFLNSTFLTLSSPDYLLAGYSIMPSQLNNKNVTTYTAT